jgi:hypothetical protein
VPGPELGFIDEYSSLDELIGGDDRLGYTLDFGDNWGHKIVAEDLLEGDTASRLSPPGRSEGIVP